VKRPDSEAQASHLRDPTRPIQRLLVVADAAVAEVDELPPRVRAVIDAAAEVYVVTPSLPGRLAWLASQLNESRHAADERLDTVLGHMRSIGACASGTTGDDSTLTAFADAVATFKPDHILIALRSSTTPTGKSEG
jgi:siroheme synthase (precorrin-2 oxidase/ferrochelatase)